MSCVARRSEYSTAAIRAPVGLRDDPPPAAPSNTLTRSSSRKTAGADRNDGAPGIDGVTFEAIEAGGTEAFLAQLRDELVARTYRPLRNRRVAIPERGGKVRVLGIPAIRDRVVQGALKLILEPIFEADFCHWSYGYRPRRAAQEPMAWVDRDIVEGKTRVIDAVQEVEPPLGTAALSQVPATKPGISA